MDNGAAFAEIQRSMGRVEGKLDGLTGEMERHRGEHQEVEKRIDTLESEYDRMKGGWAALSALAAVVAAVVTFALRWVVG